MNNIQLRAARLSRPKARSRGTFAIGSRVMACCASAFCVRCRYAREELSAKIAYELQPHPTHHDCGAAHPDRDYVSRSAKLPSLTVSTRRPICAMSSPALQITRSTTSPTCCSGIGSHPRQPPKQPRACHRAVTESRGFLCLYRDNFFVPWMEQHFLFCAGLLALESV